MSNLSKLAMTLGMKFGPIRQGVTPRRVLEYVVNDMVRAQADYKMANDPSVISRIDGMMDAYRDVAHYIAPSTVVNAKNAATAARAARNGGRVAKTAITAGSR